MRVEKVSYIKDYKIKIWFNNKEVKNVDLEKIVKENSGVFKPLRDLDYFKKVKVDEDHISIVWPNGVDLCPDDLYEIGLEEK